MSDCIFCKIRDKEIPSKQVYEDEKVLAFEDINPKDQVHLLIVPKKHIPTVAEVSQDDEILLGHLVIVAKKLAKENNLTGYKLQFNVGKTAGQIVFHVHLHLMGHRFNPSPETN